MVRIWTIDGEGREFSEFRTLHDRAPVRAVAFSRDGRLVAGGGVARQIHLWDVETGELVRDFRGHTDTVRAITFNPDGDGPYLASSSQDGTIRLWYGEKGNESGPPLRVPYPYEGMIITNATGLDAALRRDLISLGAVD